MVIAPCRPVFMSVRWLLQMTVAGNEAAQFKMEISQPGEEGGKAVKEDEEKAGKVRQPGWSPLGREAACASLAPMRHGKHRCAGVEQVCMRSRSSLLWKLDNMSRPTRKRRKSRLTGRKGRLPNQVRVMRAYDFGWS